jgi:hypothetical protein
MPSVVHVRDVVEPLMAAYVIAVERDIPVRDIKHIDAYLHVNGADCWGRLDFEDGYFTFRPYSP